jgi:hypothetical protein
MPTETKVRRVWFQRADWACCRRWGIGNTEYGDRTYWFQFPFAVQLVVRGRRWTWSEIVEKEEYFAKFAGSADPNGVWAGYAEARARDGVRA